MKRLLSSLLPLALFVVACDEKPAPSRSTRPPVLPPEALLPKQPPVDPAPPAEATDPNAPPRLGGVIDRLGRPAISLLLVAPFATPAEVMTAQDVYNKAAPADWVRMYKPIFSRNLALWDGLDRVCGNQAAASTSLGSQRYDRLAELLADDRLFVDAGKGQCHVYFGLELTATGTLPNRDCGGRQPMFDAIDTTLSLLTGGRVVGMEDGVILDSRLRREFPFLGDPN